VQRIAVRANNVVSYLLGDHLGSTSITMNTSGQKTGELRYKAFGETRFTSGTTPTKRQYTGQINEADIGLYFYNARWYDASLGRFAQADTIIPQPGNPMAWDRYSYVMNNPLRYIDPSGNFIVQGPPKTTETCGVDNWECGGGLDPEDDIFSGNDRLRQAWVDLNNIKSGHDAAQQMMHLGIPVSIGDLGGAKALVPTKTSEDGTHKWFDIFNLSSTQSTWGIIIDYCFFYGGCALLYEHPASQLELVFILRNEMVHVESVWKTGVFNSWEEEYASYEAERNIAIDIGYPDHPWLIFSPKLDNLEGEAKFKTFFDENDLDYSQLPIFPTGGMTNLMQRVKEAIWKKYYLP
jgi:RHS repeat-associated protein